VCTLRRGSPRQERYADLLGQYLGDGRIVRAQPT
jgi:hypothetical protein